MLARLSIKSRLVLLVAFMSTALILVGVMGGYSMYEGYRRLETVYSGQLLPTQHLTVIKDMMMDTGRQLLFVTMHDPGSTSARLHNHPVELHTDIIEDNLAEAEAAWKGFMASPMTAEERKLAEKFAASREQLLTQGFKPALALSSAGKYAELAEHILTVVNPATKKMRDDVDALIRLQDDQARTEHKGAVARYRVGMGATIACMVVGLLVGLLLSAVTIRTIASSARALMEASERLADGDMAARANLATKDEFGRIAGCFDRMAESFSAVIARLRESAEQVATAASEMFATAQQMATGAEQAASQSASMATAGEEMSATSIEISQNCVMAAEGAQQATETAQTGAAVVAHTVEMMSRIAERVKTSAKTVESLGTRGVQIGEIIGTIEDIADQTNLLALNAAIEAARAGEQGRGFAVVADEVRALAERTTKATREIAEMIKAIQQETRTAVAAMEEGVRDVEDGTAEASRSGESLQEILERINDVTLQVNQIATAAEEQTATTGEISGTMLQITDVIGETARGAQESTEAASRLNRLAEDLQRLVRQFRAAA